MEILKHIVPAMADDSVILFADFYFPHTSPADLPIATMDVAMLNMGGKERSEGWIQKDYRGSWPGICKDVAPRRRVRHICRSEVAGLKLIERERVSHTTLEIVHRVAPE